MIQTVAGDYIVVGGVGGDPGTGGHGQKGQAYILRSLETKKYKNIYRESWFPFIFLLINVRSVK